MSDVEITTKYGFKPELCFHNFYYSNASEKFLELFSNKKFSLIFVSENLVIK